MCTHSLHARKYTWTSVRAHTNTQEKEKKRKEHRQDRHKDSIIQELWGYQQLREKT